MTALPSTSPQKRRWHRLLHPPFVLIAIVLLLDTARLIVAPPGRTDVTVFENIRVEVTTSPAFVWNYGECVTITWEVEGGYDVYVNGITSSPSGSTETCLTRERPPFNFESPSTGNTLNYTDLAAAHRALSQYPDTLVMTRATERLDSFVHVSAPIYVLTDDVLWLWRVVVAGILAFIVLYQRGNQATTRTAMYFRGMVRRQSTLLTVVGGGVVLLVMFLTQIVPLLGIWELFAAATQQTSFLPIVPDWSGIFSTVLTLGGMSISSLLLGSAILRLFRVPTLEQNPFGLFSVRFVLGQGVYSLVLLVVVTYGQFTQGVLIGVLLVCGMIGLPIVPNLLSDLRHLVVSIRRAFSELKWVSRGLLACVVLLLFTPILNFALPVHGDGQLTHMTMVKQIATTGGLDHFPRGDLVFYYSSTLPGILQATTAYSLAGDTAARMHIWLLYIGIIGCVAGLSHALGHSRQAQAITLLAAVCSSVAYDMVGIGKVDLYSFALGIAAILVTVHLVQVPHSTAAFLAGLLAGLTVVAKMNHLVTLGPLLAIFTLTMLRPRQLPRVWLLMALGALLPLAFHMLRNGIVSGEPLAPFYFFDVELSLDSLANSNNVDQRERLDRLFKIVYPLTWVAILNGSIIGSLTPLWLMMLPLVGARMISANTARLERNLTLSTVASLVIWVALVDNIIPHRYIVVMMFVLLVIGGAGIDSLIARDEQMVKRFATYTTLFGIVIGTLLWQGTFASAHFILPELDYRCRPAPLTRCEQIQAVNEEAPPNTRVFSNQPYYFEMRSDLLLCLGTFEEHENLLNLDANETWATLYRQGFDYVMDWKIEGDYYITYYQRRKTMPVIPLDPSAAPSWLTVEEIVDNVYRLVPDENAPPRRITCEQTAPRQWELVENS